MLYPLSYRGSEGHSIVGMGTGSVRPPSPLCYTAGRGGVHRLGWVPSCTRGGLAQSDHQSMLCNSLF